jgi:hypothetical protein
VLVRTLFDNRGKIWEDLPSNMSSNSPVQEILSSPDVRKTDLGRGTSTSTTPAGVANLTFCHRSREENSIVRIADRELKREQQTVPRGFQIRIFSLSF